MTKEQVAEIAEKAYKAGQNSILEVLTPQEKEKVKFLIEKGANTADYRGKDFLKITSGVIERYKQMADSVEY